ncbi:MAG: segregation/condensation protein A [Candidatus Nanoarchaeia archaeon]|nr:segregation/condensation protein A [Candidatus Nanoarchaeia archaeon]MDD5239360.1 segregation/condensation protein A [Candidatus Nanoarchaeia archaeon]
MDEDKLYNLMISKELTVEILIRDIVQSEGLDPWNIDVGALARKYLDAIHSMQQRDIKISGQFLLAASILLKMKSDYLLPVEEEEVMKNVSEEFLEDIAKYELESHVPQPKQRKVTLDELLSSLKQAIVVSDRREVRTKERDDVKMPIKIRKVDIGKKIVSLYERIVEFFSKLKIFEIKFSQLVPSKHRWDIIWTFIPLIHLANKDKIRLRQEEEFGEIYVTRGEGDAAVSEAKSRD